LKNIKNLSFLLKIIDDGSKPSFLFSVSSNLSIHTSSPIASHELQKNLNVKTLFYIPMTLVTVIPKGLEDIDFPPQSARTIFLQRNRQIKYLNNIIEQDHRSSATRKAVSEITNNPSPFRLGSPYRSMSSW
jgi:hypothetical protein